VAINKKQAPALTSSPCRGRRRSHMAAMQGRTCLHLECAMTISTPTSPTRTRISRLPTSRISESKQGANGLVPVGPGLILIICVAGKLRTAHWPAAFAVQSGSGERPIPLRWSNPPVMRGTNRDVQTAMMSHPRRYPPRPSTRDQREGNSFFQIETRPTNSKHMRNQQTRR
jgi:hypothetical protein